MADVNILFYNDSLKKFVESMKINSKQKEFLLSRIPEMNSKERENLFKTLTKVYFLDQKKAEAIERVEKFWQQ